MQSRYEGPDLEGLLEKVRSELGGGVTIVAANKIRSGGIAGFFAREAYEVVVEHDALDVSPDVANDPTRSVRPPDLAPSLMDLVDQVSAEERAVAPRISTESEPFAAVLERVARDAGMPAQSTADTDAEQVDDADSDAEIAEAASPAPAPTVVSAPPILPQPAPVPAAAAVPATQPAPVAAPAPSPAPPVGMSAPAGHVGALVKMGLPATYVPAAPSAAAFEAALRSSLSRLPAAPAVPQTTGSVLAVIGERSAAMELARELSAEAGLDPDAITIATRKRVPARTPENLVITGSDDAVEKRRSWRRRDRASVVVIDTEMSTDRPAWAYHVLAALEPEATWGVVDATRKTEDVAAWVNGLGGVDALAVNDIDATSSPASVLQLEVPVGRIDGRPASPALWAALLSERLAA